MIFKKTVEDRFKALMYVRCDDTGLVHYYSHRDFDGMQAEGYTFKSSLGHNMQGYFYSYDGADTKRLIVFEHGFGGGHRSYMKEIERLCRAGYRVFAYDHTGCMESGGEGARGFSQSLRDLDDCLNVLKADKNIDSADISVVGHSWGGYSTLNIPAIHSDVKKIVVLSGIVSVKKIVTQYFSSVLKAYHKDILRLEEETNGVYSHYDGVETLQKSETEALLIYSDDDPLVHKKVHYDALYEGLKDKENVQLVLTCGKGHNPNYTDEAVVLLRELTRRTKAESHNLDTAEKKLAFKNSFDWEKITRQDDEVWKTILEFLE